MKLATLFLLTFLLLCPSQAQEEGELPEEEIPPPLASLSRLPYVQQLSPTSAVIVWRTLGQSEPKVWFGERVSRLDQEVSSEQVTTRVKPPFLPEPAPEEPPPFEEIPPEEPLPPEEEFPPFEEEAPESAPANPPKGGPFRGGKQGATSASDPTSEFPEPDPAPAKPVRKGGRGPFADFTPPPPEPIDYSQYPQLSEALEDTWQFEVTLSGLKPNTKYYYSVSDGDRLLEGGDEQHFFVTSPLPSASPPLRFWVVGDSGLGNVAQRDSFAAMKAFVARDKRPISAFLHVGDMAYGSGTDDQFQSYFFDIYSSLLRNTVIWPTQGNHEGFSSSGSLGEGPYYDAYVTPTKAEAGGVASGTETYYSFDHGPVHFVCLNSHDIDRSLAGDMALWLKEDLAATKAQWLIAFWHHPPYSKGTHDSDIEHELVEMRTVFIPILESAGVDLVLCGHSHTYERSMLLDGAYQTPTVVEGVIFDDGDGNPARDGAYRKSANLNPHEGMVAVVSGHGSSAGALGVMQVMRSVWVEPGSFILDIDGDTASGTMLNHAGEVRDRFQIVKRGKLSPQRVDYPWQPVGPVITTAQPGPGITQITIKPQPAAPDAKIFYTLDGSPPTLESAIYQQPFEVRSDVRIQAFSVWRNGVRQSLTTETETIAVNRSFLARIPVQHSEDDAQQRGNEIATDGSNLSLSQQAAGNHLLGVRFRNIQVPKDALVTRAYLQFTSFAANTKDDSMLIQGESSANSLAYGASSPLSARQRTVNATIWRIPQWFQAELRHSGLRSPDLSTLLQEIVNQPDWQSGNALSLMLSGTGTSSWYSVDGAALYAPELFLTYEPISPLQAAVAQPPVLRLEANGRIAISVRRLKAALAYGISYSWETTTDLAAPVWEPFLPGEITAVPMDGVWEQISFKISHGELKQRFLRLKATRAAP